MATEYICIDCEMTAATDDLTIIGRNCMASDFELAHQMMPMRDWVTADGHACTGDDCGGCSRALAKPLPLHRTEAGYPNCSTCDGGGCPDCTDPA